MSNIQKPIIQFTFNNPHPTAVERQAIRDEIHRCTFGHLPAYLAAGGVACYRCGTRLA